MTILKAIVKEGRIELKAPADWPDGTEVRIEPVPVSIGMRAENWPTTPEAIARHVALMGQFEPLDISPEEEAEWEAARQDRKDLKTSRFGTQAGSA